MSNVSHSQRLHSALLLLGTGVIGAVAGAQLDVFASQPAAGGALAVAAGTVCAALALRRRAARVARVDVAALPPASPVSEQEAALREAEAQLVALREELEAAEARHREELRLSDGDARELVQQAQAALEARAQFLANISHELRTPMNAVLGMSELLQQGDLSAEHRRMVDAVHGAGQELLTLINDVLDFSNLEARPPSLDEHPFDLRHVVESVIGLFAKPAKAKGLLLGYLISEEVPDGFSGDAGRLRQLLGNLLSNAVKFTARGSVVLRIGGQPGDDGRFSLIFTVQDTGVGVEEGLLEQLFRPFEQRDAAMNRSYGGAGLGLAISRSLAEAMGGTISADSRPGEGSTFRLHVALPTASVMTEAGLRGAGSRSILCANLKPLLSEILSDQGRALGAQVALAPDSGPEALRALLQGGGFDAIAVGAAPGEQGGAMTVIELLRELGEAAPALILVGDDIDATLLTYAEQPLLLTTPLQITALQEGLAEMWGAQTPTERTRSYQPTRAYVPQGTGGRIMLAEDNPVNQGVARRMLERMGCTVELVCDGEAALTAWRTRRYDAILMDCQMPGLDGYQATGKIREEEARRGLRRIPIIAMTANAMRGDRGRCLESGMDDYLAKPFSHARLQEILSKWVAPGSGDQASPFDPALLDPMAIGEALALGGEEILVELFETWLESSARLMAQMERALAADNSQAFKIAVHTLKSSSGSIGARDLAELLQDMDRLASIDAVQAAGALLPEARGRWEAIRDVAAEYVARSSGTSEAPSTEPLSQSGAPILVVDDDPTIRLLIRNALSGLECHLIEAGSGEEAVTLFAEVRPRLVLLDVMMDGMDGFEVCRKLRQHQHGENLPILMMTGLDDLSSIAQAYEAGATDFVVKPFNTQILYNRVLYLLRAHKALEALRASQDEIYTLAYYDTVTGLPNRLRFTERLEEELETARREALKLSVMFIDLDRFKRINDTLGHPVGDQLLRCVADRLQAVLLHTEHESMIARFGGDEFVLLQTGFPDDEAPNHLARKLIDALQRPFLIEGNELVVTASLGMTHYPANGSTADALLRDADVAMYQIKELGGNGFQHYIKSEGLSGYERLELEAALRRALERDEFEVFYQPKLDSRSWKITGVEALIRWRHPTHGLVSPGHFIPLAEETGMIIPIGDWVLAQACEEVRPWIVSGQIGRLAVNLSARQFSDDQLMSRIEAVLENTGFPANQLELEVTESMVIDNIDSAIQTMRQIRQMGIEIAIDDFGTGHSSLSYLHRFPIHSLKIDRAFIRDLSGEQEDSPIADMVIALGRALKLRVVAEGVETTEQLSYLCQAGCDELQGYLISRPLPIDRLATFVADHEKKSA